MVVGRWLLIWWGGRTEVKADHILLAAPFFAGASSSSSSSPGLVPRITVNSQQSNCFAGVFHKNKIKCVPTRVAYSSDEMRVVRA